MIFTHCDHPRQRSREFEVPGATEEEADQLVFCAYPRCPAGVADFGERDGGLILVGDLSNSPPRNSRVTLNRRQVDGAWRWETVSRDHPIGFFDMLSAAGMALDAERRAAFDAESIGPDGKMDVSAIARALVATGHDGQPLYPWKRMRGCAD